MAGQFLFLVRRSAVFYREKSICCSRISGYDGVMIFTIIAAKADSASGVSAPEMGFFLLQALVISLTGVLAPGPMSATTLALGARSRHAGGWIALGHGIVEFPLMIGILAGIGEYIETPMFQIVGSVLGGGFLIWTAWQGIRPSGAETAAQPKALRHHPAVMGILLSITNPYFLMWWATIGLGLIQTARNLGLTAFVLFTVIHWSCDLVWLEGMSWSCHQGTRWLGEKAQLWMLRIGSGVIAVFGVLFLVKGIRIILFQYPI